MPDIAITTLKDTETEKHRITLGLTLYCTSTLYVQVDTSNMYEFLIQLHYFIENVEEVWPQMCNLCWQTNAQSTDRVTSFEGISIKM